MTHLEFKDKQFDYAMAVDVLHHCNNIPETLKEMIRVSNHVIIKDHFYQNRFGHFLLKLFDVSANKPYGIQSIFNFLKWDEWEHIFHTLNLDQSFLDKSMDRIKMGPLKHFCILLEENGKK